jgi:hypothetical protein
LRTISRAGGGNSAKFVGRKRVQNYFFKTMLMTDELNGAKFVGRECFENKLFLFEQFQ